MLRCSTYMIIIYEKLSILLSYVKNLKFNIKNHQHKILIRFGLHQYELICLQIVIFHVALEILLYGPKFWPNWTGLIFFFPNCFLNFNIKIIFLYFPLIILSDGELKKPRYFPGLLLVRLIVSLISFHSIIIINIIP